MSEPRILVIGEKFIDRYYVGTATRLSPEAPIPVVAVKEVIQFAGGAGNVYQNLKALGAEASLLSSFGEGPPRKNRLIANGLQIARWDEHDRVSPLRPLRENAFERFDGIIISDYNKGFFTPEGIKNLLKIPMGIPLFVDTKNPGPWPHYNTFFFPNMREWQASEQTYALCANVIRTESEQGMTHLQFNEAKWHTNSAAKDIVSVCGAGDTAIAAFAYQYCKTKNVVEAMSFARAACAVVCGKPYTAIASHEEINKIRG